MQSEGEQVLLIKSPTTPTNNFVYRVHALSITIVCLVLYSFADLALPLYNKVLDNGFGSEQGFHYPVTSALVQVGTVAICLLIYILLERAWNKRHNPEKDWLFASLRGFARKVYAAFNTINIYRRELIVVSFLFAGIITLSNIGLDKVSLNVHVLLRTTSFVWVLLFSFFIKGERPSVLQIAFAMLVIVGAVLLSVDATKDWDPGNTAGIIINLASSFCSGLATVLLRNVCIKTERIPELRMSIIDITMIKMALASMFMFIPALVLDTFLHIKTNDTVWQALKDQWPMALMVLLGACITLVYQSSVVAVTAHTGAVSVGILHQILTFVNTLNSYIYRLPQLGLYTILIVTHALPENWKIKILKATPFHIAGATLILTGTALYALLRLYKLKVSAKQDTTQTIDEEDLIGSVNDEEQEPRWSRLKRQVRDWRSWLI